MHKTSSLYFYQENNLNNIKKYLHKISLFTPNIKSFMFGSFLLSIGVNQIWLLFNLYLKSLNINESLIGNVLSLRSIGAVIIAIPASFIMLKGKVKPLLLISSIFNTIFFILISATSTIGIISISIFFIGMFSTIYRVATAPFIMRNTSIEERGYVFGLNSALMMGAGIIGSIIGGISRDYLSILFNSNVLAYKTALGMGALFSLASLIPFLKIHSIDVNKNQINLKNGQNNSSINTSRKINNSEKKLNLFKEIKTINHKKFIKLLIPVFFIGLGAGITIPFINLYFKLEWKLNDSYIGLIFGFGQLFTFTGMILSPVIAHKFTKVKTIVWTQILSIPFILVLAYLKYLPMVIFAFLIRQALMNMNTPVNDHFAMEYVSEKEQPIVNALKMVTWTGSWAVSASIGGYIIQNYSFSVSFTFTAIAYFSASTLFYIFFHKIRN